MEKLAKMQLKSENSELKSPQKQVKTITFRKQRFSRYSQGIIIFHSYTIFLRVTDTRFWKSQTQYPASGKTLDIHIGHATT